MNGIAAPAGRTISVVLADDNLIVREGVRALINRSPDLDVTGVAGDYDEVIAACSEHAPGICSPCGPGGWPRE
jgi:DNA-binding NarL/FixJ family response regulator